jgi:hypothetical protein
MIYRDNRRARDISFFLAAIVNMVFAMPLLCYNIVVVISRLLVDENKSTRRSS